MKLRLSREGSWHRTVALLLTSVYVGSFVLDSPLRFGLSQVGAAALIYLRDGFSIILIAIMFTRGLFWRIWPTPPLIALCILGLHSAIGFLVLGSPAQVFYGIKTFLPLVGGLVAGSMFSEPSDQRRLYIVVLPLWILAIAGVFVELAGVQFPWKGFETEVGGISIEGNRDWTTGGLNRLAGFGRVSTDTANAILLLFCAIAFRTPVRWRIILLIASFLGILATTSKATIISAAASGLIILFLSIRPHPPKLLTIIITFLVISFAIIIPSLALAGVLTVNIENPIQFILLGSFVDRIQNTWPEAISMLHESPIPWLGRGVGGIGVPQQFFEPLLYSPGDNQFIYFLVCFGPLALIYCGLLFLRTLPSLSQTQTQWKERNLAITAWMGLGITGAPIESAVASFLLGMVLCLPAIRRNHEPPESKSTNVCDTSKDSCNG